MAKRMMQNRRSKALALLESLDPAAPSRVAENLDALSDDFLEVVLGFAFADVVPRPGLDLRTREMLTVSALMAMGTAPGQLELRAALNVGVTREEIVEILLQIAVYTGVPACIDGIVAAKKTFSAATASQFLALFSRSFQVGIEPARGSSRHAAKAALRRH